MKFTLGILTLILSFLYSCDARNENKSKQITQEKTPTRNHSYANIEAAHTTHLHLDLAVDFEQKKLSGVARHQIENNKSSEIIFDINGLKINKVTISIESEELNTSHEIKGAIHPILGQALHIKIEPNTKYVNIYYETTEKSEALDWLDSALTSSKTKPFLYTQGQAILTRTWIPIQDVPSNRITYSADLAVPKDLMAVMSASNPQSKNDEGLYHFEMHQPIPCYLIALAVGDLVYGKLG